MTTPQKKGGRRVDHTSAKGLPPVNWMIWEERYAAEPMLTLEQIAKETGRTRATVKTHYSRGNWKARRIQVQAKTRAAIQAKLQQRAESFALYRQGMLITAARRALKAIAANLQGAGGEHGFGVEKVDAYQLQALLKTYDESTLEGKVAAQLTPILFQTLERQATDELTAAKLREFQAQAQQSRPASSSTSTRTLPYANGRAASLFSRPNGTS